MNFFLDRSLTGNRNAIRPRGVLDGSQADPSVAEADARAKQQQEAEAAKAKQDEEARANAALVPLGRPKTDAQGQLVSDSNGATQMVANVGGVGGIVAASPKGKLLLQAERAQATNPFYQSQIDKRKKRGISVQAQL